ncbi:MAG TPA: hypothetical protein VFE16_05265 [Candidatus Cybelea sp.]|jgi:hypothetical protein|nr:hypothetical protein [Candidatus Cybelea sp.]
MAYKLGKLPARHDPRTLMLTKYLTTHLPAPPASKDYGAKVEEQAKQSKAGTWPMYSNDTLGDCTCAAIGHMVEVWTANATKLLQVPDADVVKLYRHFSPPGTDNGANLLDVLTYIRKNKVGEIPEIAAFVGLEPKNHNQAKDSLDLFGTVYIGVSLPDSVVPENDPNDWLKIPWTVPPTGPHGKAAPNPQNGHCIPAVAYDDRNLYIITWGALKAMSWSFYDAYADEAYAVLSDKWLSPAHVAPPGFDLEQLKQDLAALSGAHANKAVAAV